MMLCLLNNVLKKGEEMKKLNLLLLAITIVFASVLMAENILVNPSFEDQTPAFWAPLNGTQGTELGVESEAANVYSGLYSFKITKDAASTGPVGWLYEHPINMFWAGADVATYELKAMIKTDGVNVNPVDDDAKIGVTFEFLDADGNALVDATTLYADQTSASVDWTEYAGAAILTVAPTTIRVTQFMGINATGTVYLDNVNTNWKVFNSGAETVEGWMNWYAGDNGSYGTVTDNDANTGSYAAELFKPDTTSSTSEIVYYSIPVAVEAGEWYKVGFWAKTEGVNDSSTYEPTYIMKDRLDERIGMTYFFHTGSVETEWATLGGDKFVYVDQTTTSNGWTHYAVAEQAPAEATGISVRARYTSNPTGTTWFDDFSVEKIVVSGDQLVINPGFEDQTPAFWAPLNGTQGTELGVESEAANVYSGLYSFKITKDAASTGPVGWLYEHPINMFWAGADVATYELKAMIKTDGVNVNPVDDDAKIGVTFEFLDADGNALVDATTLYADQTSASVDWTEYAGAAILTVAPTTIRVTQFMGINATGTVYLDNVNTNWKVFNSGAETVEGWMNWYAGDNGSYGTVTDNDANTGSYAAELFKPDTTSSTSEIVYYSIPVAVEAGEWYKVGFWAKTEGVNDSSTYEPTYIMKDRLDERIGMTYFFHTGSVETEWATLGGDKFVYVDQTTTSNGWTHYAVAEQAPAEATGISVRARYTSNPTGTTWFDDFSVEKMVVSGSTAIEDDENNISSLPDRFLLKQNYPNPFNPETQIEFYVLKNSEVNVSIYNILGQKVKTLVNSKYTQGYHNAVWNAKDDNGSLVSTGIYIYVMTVGDKRFTRKMALIR